MSRALLLSPDSRTTSQAETIIKCQKEKNESARETLNITCQKEIKRGWVIFRRRNHAKDKLKKQRNRRIDVKRVDAIKLY